MLPVLLLLGSIAGSIPNLLAFTSQHSHSHSSQRLSPPGGYFRGQKCNYNYNYNYNYNCKYCRRHHGVAEGKGEDSVRVRDLLSDLPTPTLLIELSLAESALNHTSMSLDDFLQHDAASVSSSDATLDGCLFVHTSVVDTSARDRINQDLGSGKSPVIGSVDVCSQQQQQQQHVPGGAFLGIGLSNHHVGGYYWARGMGIGASLEAHGVAFRDAAAATGGGGGGELYWEKRGSDPTTTNAEASVSRGATTDESSNSNDGKRSEWADFLVCGDTVQLIPYNATRVLRESAFQRLVGVRRVGRPLGADPIVERLWKRESSAADESGSRSHFESWTPIY